VVCFSSGNNVKDKLHSRCSCTTVTPQIGEHLIQLIIRLGSADYSQETVHRLVGNDDGSVEILQSLHEVGPMSTHIGTEREHCMHICQYLLNKYEAEGDSFLDLIITGDEAWCHL